MVRHGKRGVSNEDGWCLESADTTWQARNDCLGRVDDDGVRPRLLQRWADNPNRHGIQATASKDRASAIYTGNLISRRC